MRTFPESCRKRRQIAPSDELVPFRTPDVAVAAFVFPRRRCRYRRGDLQGALADRVVFPGLETVAAGEDVCGDFRQCLENAALDGADRHAGGEIPATAIDLRLVPFESGGTPAAAVVRLP